MIDIFLVQKLLCLGEIYLLQMHMLLFLYSELVISACELFLFPANYYIWDFWFSGQLYQYFLMSYVFASC